MVRDPARTPSNWRSRRPLDEELQRQGIVGVAGVDTRALVRHLRERGAMRAGVFSGDALARPTPSWSSGCGRARRWRAPTSTARSPPARPTSCPRTASAVPGGRAGRRDQVQHPRGCWPRAASRRTCCPRPRRSRRSRRWARTGSSCPTGRATRPPPTRRSRSPARCWSGGSRCSGSASATRSWPARWAAAPTSCATATAASTSRSSSTPPGGWRSRRRTTGSPSRARRGSGWRPRSALP